MLPEDPQQEIYELRRKVVALEGELENVKAWVTANERSWLQLADAVSVMFWMSGTDAQCTYFNRAWLEFRGRTLESEAGSEWVKGLHLDDRDLCLGAYLKAFSAREPFRVQFRLRRADGEYSWVAFSGAPRFELDGSFTGFFGFAVEMTRPGQPAFTPDEEAVRMVFALTERERQVLVLIASGKSTKELATRLGISYKTADSHRSRILEKLGVHETASMVRYAIRAGLIEP